MRLWAMLAALGLLAGCAESPNSGGASKDDEREKPVFTPPRFATLIGCTGLDFDGRGTFGLQDTPAPPGWERDNPNAGVNWVLVECERLVWGNFSRSIAFMVEFHSDFTSPAACSSGTPDRVIGRSMMSKLWVNDTEVAEWLGNTYPGIPTGVLVLSWTETVGAVERKQAHWGPPGAAPSVVTAYRIPDEPVEVETGHRLFWWNETGVVALDFLPTYTSRTVVAAANWTIRDPMLHGLDGDEPGPATVRFHEPSSIAMAITPFVDHECSAVYE